MKRVTAILLLCCLLAGCAQPGTVAEEPYVQPREQPNGVIETPKGVFRLTFGTLTRLLPEEGRETDFCDEAGCSHMPGQTVPDGSDWACSGYFGSGSDGDYGRVSLSGTLGYYRDQLWLLGVLPDGTTVLYSVDPDTGERRREKIMDPGEPFDHWMALIQVRYLFRGNTLVLIFRGSQDESLSDAGITRIRLLDLKTLELRPAFEKQLDRNYEGNYVELGNPRILEDGALYAVEQISMAGKGGMERVFELVRYDLDTGETATVCDAAGVMDYRARDGRVCYIRTNGEVWFGLLGTSVTYAVDTLGTYHYGVYDPETDGKTDLILLDDADGLPRLYALPDMQMIIQSDFLYSDDDPDQENWQTQIGFYASDGRKLGMICLPESAWLWYMGADRLYFGVGHDGRICYLDLDRIGTGPLELCPV